MLAHTFCHIKGLSCQAEKRLWDLGIISWDDYLKNTSEIFSEKKDKIIREEIEASKIALKAPSIDFFFSRLPIEQKVRLYPQFKDKIVFVDIETTGLSIKKDLITAIAVYDGKIVKNYINGQNLWDFVADITKYTIIVTYNGIKFDIPFLKKFFGLSLNHFHIDLCPILHKFGYYGGLKKIERTLGIKRQIEDVTGKDAVVLWKRYKNENDNNALNKLILYNSQDVLTLEQIMIKICNKAMEDCPIINKLPSIKK
ncbi:MAG: ribonuclease H-like domain-containing protein [Candidatus Anammoxibacter sp.]